MPRFEPAQVGSYELEIDINSSRENVWKALTKETNAWWLPSFHMVGEGSIINMRAEAGGQLLEKKENGAGLLWCTVHAVDPGNSIHFVGHSFPAWGGPGTSMLIFNLEDNGNGCKLKVSDHHFGLVTEQHLTSLQEGWTLLFTEGLKKHCEA